MNKTSFVACAAIIVDPEMLASKKMVKVLPAARDVRVSCYYLLANLWG
jgi:hypothetical protein